VKSHAEIQSNKDGRGLHEPPNSITSELCHQGITRSHINSNGINSGPALPDFPPTSAEMCTDQSQQDVSKKYPVTNFAAYPPHDAKISSSSSSDYSAVLGIAQPPSRFSSNLTYTQSKISRNNNYMRLFSDSCLEDSYSPSHSGGVVSNGFVSNSSPVTVNTLATSGPSHQQIPYHNKEIPNTRMNCSVQIRSPSGNSLPLDSSVRYGSVKDSSETPAVITTSASAAAAQISPHLQSCGRMSSDNISSYHSGSATMQVVESDPLCSLGNSAGLSMNSKILNSSSYMISSPHRREPVVAGSQHVPFQNVLAGVGSEHASACNMFCGSNSSVLHSGLFDDFSKNCSSTHILGTKADMISQSSKQNCEVTPPNIYSQSNMSAPTGGVDQQLLPLMEDMGSRRPIKKRKSHTKGMAKRDQVHLLGKRWHQGSSTRQVALAPVLDVRQFLATWDEETDDLSPVPRLPDVVLSNSSTDNPLLVLDCRNLNTNGVATLSTVDRSSLSDGSPTENLIHVYQQQLTSPSESSNASNDTVKSNSQTLQENSDDVMVQPLGECPSLIPIDPNQLEKFGPPNSCIKSFSEHGTFEHNVPSFHQGQESRPSTSNDGSENSDSKSDTVDGLVEASAVSVVDKIHSGLDISTDSVVSDIPVHGCRTVAESSSSQASSLPEDCGRFHEIHEKSCGTDSQNSFVAQDECRTSDVNCQNVQGNTQRKSTNCNCQSSDKKMPLSCSEIQHVSHIRLLEKKRADYHHRRKGRTTELTSLMSNNRTVVHTLKALCRSAIERSTKVQQKFEKQLCSHEKASIRSYSEEEDTVLGSDCHGSLSDKEVDKIFAENSSSVLESKNITDIACSSENSSTKDVAVCMSESTGLPYLSEQTNNVSYPKMPLKKKPSSNNEALFEQTENTNRTGKDVKLTFTFDVLVKEKPSKETSAPATEICDSELNNLTQTINTERAVGSPALKLLDKALPSSRCNLKTVNEAALINTDIVLTRSPASLNMTAEEMSSTRLQQNSIEKGITGNELVMTDEEKLSEQDMKCHYTEPVECRENGRDLHEVSVSVTSESEPNQLNLFSCSNDTGGEDLDMSVTSSAPATPVNVEEVVEESGSEELDVVYQDSVLSDLESDIRLQSHDCISFSSLPHTSQRPICEDDGHSYDSLGMFEALDKSRVLPGTADGSMHCLVEEHFDSEILSDNKDEVVGMCVLKMSDKTCNNKCDLISSSQTKPLGNNTELSSCSESSLDVPDSCVEEPQRHPIKLLPCQLLEVSHESDLLPNRIQNVSRVMDILPSCTVVLGRTESDSKSIECVAKMQLESERKNSTEFIPVARNSAVEAYDVLRGEVPVTNILAKQFSCSHNGTEVDCLHISKPGNCEKDNISDSLLCDVPVITADSDQQNEDGNSVDETSLHIPSDTTAVLCEGLDLKCSENKMDLSTKNTSLDVSVKNVSVASVPSSNGDHSLLVCKEVNMQKEGCLLLNDNSVVRTSSFSGNPMSSGGNELAVSDDLEETLRVNDERQDSKTSSCGHNEMLCNYGSQRLEIEATNDEICKVFPLVEGSACSERSEISKNHGTVKSSILETTVRCSENLTCLVKGLETSPDYGESVEVIQPLHCDTLQNSETFYDTSPKCPVHQECTGSPSTSYTTIRNGNLSQTNQNSSEGHVPHKEDDSIVCVELRSSSSHTYSRSVLPLVSESRTVPKNILQYQLKCCDCDGEDKLSIAAAGCENEQNCKMNCDKSNNIGEPQNSGLLLNAGAKSASVQNDMLIVHSQKTVELKSSTGHQTSGELENEIVAHDCQVIDCETESEITKIPFQDSDVADCETCHLDPSAFSKNTSSKRQEDSIPEEKLITGSSSLPHGTESQNKEYLQKKCNKISHNEPKIGAIRKSFTYNVCREDNSVTDSDGNTSCKEQNAGSSVTVASASDTVIGGGDDADDDAAAAAVVSHEDCGDSVAVPVNADPATEEHYDDTDICTADITDDVASTTTTTAAAAAIATTDSGSDGDNTDTVYDGVTVSTATTTSSDEADAAGNMDACISCKVQSNVTYLNLVRYVSNADITTTTTTTITTTVSDADTTTTTFTTTVSGTDTTTTTAIVSDVDTVADTSTNTIITSSAVASATDITADDTDDANIANDEVNVNTASVITVAAVIAVTTTAAATTTTSPMSCSTSTTSAAAAASASATVTDNDTDTDVTTFAAAATAVAATLITSGGYGGSGGGSSKGSGVAESLVIYAAEEDRQHQADNQCIIVNQNTSRSQEMEQNDTNLEQTHITSMITSGSVTFEEEDAIRLPVCTTENQECDQPEGKHETTWNLELIQNCKASTEVNCDESLKLITPCKGPAIPADLLHDTYHTESESTRKSPEDPDTVESKSHQQDEPNQEEICGCEIETVADHMEPLQLQCQLAVEPMKDELNNYIYKLHDESNAVSKWEERLSLEEMHKSNIHDCLLDMSHDVPLQQEHCYLVESIKDEICNSELNMPSETPVQSELKSANRIIKNEINCEVNIASDDVSIHHEYHSPLELNKEEISEFKINMPENVSCCLSTEQDSSEDLDEARIASCVLHISAESSLKEECLSLQETNSKPNSPISETSELVRNNTPILASTDKTVELLQSNVSTQNSPYRQQADFSVDTDDMPQLEVIDREVSPNSSDSLEMPCLELITDSVLPVGSDQVKCPGNVCASVSSVPPLHGLPENMNKNAKGSSTELGIADVQKLQENSSLTLEAAVSSQLSVHESEHNKDTEMSVHSQDQVINSTDTELRDKHVSSVSATYDSSLSLEEENFTEDCVISVSHNSDMVQDDQTKCLSTEAPVTEECDGSLVKAVECETQEVSVIPETLQVLSKYLDSGHASVKMVDVGPEYVQVLQTDVSGGLKSVHLVTSDMTYSPCSEKTQSHIADISTDEEVLTSTDVQRTQLSSNLENETSLLSVELNECGTETNFNLEDDNICLTEKENEAVISVHSENVNLATAALPDILDEPSSVVYSVLPGLDPSLGDIMPADSVSNWPYLEEEVLSEFPAAEMDSSNSVSGGPCLTPVQSIPSLNGGDTAESESSLSSDSNSLYNFTTQSESDDAPVAMNGLKCRLSWKKIFALSKDYKNRKQETKNGKKPKATRENPKFCDNSGQQLKEYSEICHANDRVKLVNKCERLNGNLKGQSDLKDKGISGLELGPAKIEVRLPASPSPRGHPKEWRVVDGPKAERVLNQGGSSKVLLSASAGNTSCRSVARDVEPLTSGVTQMPIVLVKRLILKRRCDDDSDADSDIKSKKLNLKESSDTITRSSDSDGLTQVTVSFEQVEVSDEAAYDSVTPCGKRLEHSEYKNDFQERRDSSSSTLMTDSSSSQQTETQAAEVTDSSSSDSEENQNSQTSVVSNSEEVVICKSSSSSSLILSEEKDADRIYPPDIAYKTHGNCADDDKPVDIDVNLNVSFNELSSTNSSVSCEDNTKQQLPRVIIKRTVGMGNTNKYQSFLRSVSSSSESSNRWQPVVRLERSLSLDELAKNSSVNSGTLEGTKMPDSSRHGLKISLRSPPGHPYVTLVPLPSSACSSLGKNKSHSERTKKQRYGTSRISSRRDLNDCDLQRHARKLASLKSSFCVRHDPCLTSLPTNTRQLPSPKSCLGQSSPPIKLKFFNNCSRVQSGTFQMDSNKTVTGNCGDGGDEYVVVENRNYTKDNMTKITFQRHKKKEVSVRKECKEVEMKVNKFKRDLDIPPVPNQNIHADILSVQGTETACTAGSNCTSDLTVSPQETGKRRLCIEFDQETSKRELYQSHKKRMLDVSHAITSSEQEIATALKGTGCMVSQNCSQSEATILNDKPSAALQPKTVQSGTASNDSCPKIFNMKKRQYFEDLYLEKDVLPLFQPDRILSISSTKKKQFNPKRESLQLDGKALEEEIKSLSADAHMDYSEIVSKQVMEGTVVKPKKGQKCAMEESVGTFPIAEKCSTETLSSKDEGLLLVSSSKESECELHALSDRGTECVGSPSMMKAEEEQKLWNDIQPSVVESTRQADDACQACGHVYRDRDERTLHIRRHPYHCQRCHLAFRSEVSAKHTLIGNILEKLAVFTFRSK
jgi:hypothetical protein